MAEVRHLGLFPYCVRKENPYTGEFSWVGKAIRTNLRGAMALYWRIKRIKITIDSHFERWMISEDGDLVQEYSIDVSNEFFAKANHETEKDPICLGIFGLQWTSETEGLIIEQTGENLFNPLWENEDEYNLGFPFRIIHADPQESRNETSLFIGYPLSDDPYWSGIENIVTQEETINISNNITIKTNTVKTFFNLENIGFFVAKINNWSFEIAEWWEYDPNDGKGPIYDKVTGAKIRTDRGMGPPWSSQ